MTASPNVRQGAERFIELDSIRGVAAMTVMIGHLCAIWVSEMRPEPKIWRWFLLFFNISAGNAVILFFVLSGFVLSLPAVAGRPQPYLTFVVRRVFRIYVPYLGALALTVAGAFWLHSRIVLSDGTVMLWSAPLDWHLVRQHLLFLGNYNADELDLPVWSLVHEMRISVFFPGMCAILLRFQNRWLLVIAPLISCALIITNRLSLPVDWWRAGTTVQFAALFILGIYLAREQNNLTKWLNARSRSMTISVGIACLLLYALPTALIDYFTLTNPRLRYIYLGQWLTALGASGLMIFGIQSQFCKRILNWAPLLRLGEMSYSLYLLHYVVLLYCLHLLFGKIPLFALLLLVAAISLVISRFWYRAVEVPSNKLGRRLSVAKPIVGSSPVASPSE